MKLLAIDAFFQSYSYCDGPKPKKVWTVAVSDPSSDGTAGVGYSTLEAIAEHSDDWAGWGFRDGKAWLLFKLKTDAIYAKMMFGDGK